mmetsp:Transcript_43783/g.105604  ORF Transcript_43783/g.105604 Transcript_43783/m.105604 type:complete len:130 (-) Transcript_43783:271-660(-)
MVYSVNDGWKCYCQKEYKCCHVARMEDDNSTLYCYSDDAFPSRRRWCILRQSPPSTVGGQAGWNDDDSTADGTHHHTGTRRVAGATCYGWSSCQKDILQQSPYRHGSMVEIGSQGMNIIDDGGAADALN